MQSIQLKILLSEAIKEPTAFLNKSWILTFNLNI